MASCWIVAGVNVVLASAVFAFMIRHPIAVPSGMEDRAPVLSGIFWTYPLCTAVLGLSFSHCWKNAAGKSQGGGQSLRQYLIALLLGATLVHAVLVLFGAPVFDLVDRTFLCALVVCSLTIAPTAVTIDTVNPKKMANFLLLTSANYKIDKARGVVRVLCVCTCAGTWLSALLIPLDWDRPWQVC